MRAAVRFGAFLLAPQYPGQDHGTVLAGTVAAAVAADEAGFDEVWVAEHHFISYGVCPSAVTLAGYLLAATRRVAVGTAVSVLSTARYSVLTGGLDPGHLAAGVAHVADTRTEALA
ncbi:MAG: LLM class flavin-dependent oxidoreductase, partial [Pseudonocardiaceae bacterium]